MKLIEVDKAILKSVQEKPLTTYEIEAAIYRCVTPRSKRAFMPAHLKKLISCGLLSCEISTANGQAYYSITELATKLLRSLKDPLDEFEVRTMKFHL